LLANIYLSYATFPWYFASATLIAAVAIAFALGDAARVLPGRVSGGPRDVARAATLSRYSLPPWLAPSLRWGAALILVGIAATLTEQVTEQLAIMQQSTEQYGTERIGRWLKAELRPGDTVFLEPLGYIGYFSGAKTYDYPGLSSPEVVAARR